MASFPTSVKTFTGKNAGDVIQPSHVVDLQDEVTAIEDGILNGTAPINSSRITAPSAQFSNSTISSLTVGTLSLSGGFSAGNSTISSLVTSVLSVTSSATLADLTVTAGPAVAIVAGAAQAVSGSGTTFAFATDEYVVPSVMHSTATNNSRVYPASSGVYSIIGSVGYGGLGTDLTTNAYQQITLRVDGSSVIATQTVNPIGGGNALAAQISAIYRFASTSQYVELRGLSGIGTPNGTPRLSVVKLR